MKILLVEDDERIAELVRRALVDRHYLVEWATDGKVGWKLAESLTYDLILLDVVLPEIDGINLCQRLRKKGDRTPIILLTALDSSTKKVTGLDAGADDYIVKPFDVQELLARIRALLRRGDRTLSPLLEWGLMRLDPVNCQVTYSGKPLSLTAKEYGILELFLRNRQRIFSQSTLLDRIWSFEEPPSESAVRTQIKSLRQKLKKAGAPADFIETIYGLGYRLNAAHAISSPRRDLYRNTRPPIDRETNSGSPSAGDPCETGDNRQQQTSNEADAANDPPAFNPSKLAAIWERHKQKYSDRLTGLERAVTALCSGNLTEALQEQALKDAHTLAGSLGSFGLREASSKSREIEKILQSEEKLLPGRVKHLCELIVALRQELETEESSISKPQPSVTEAPNSQCFLPVKPQSRLLIVDDDTALARAVEKEAIAWGMQAEAVFDIARAREAIACQKPDAVLLDLCFPDSAENGFELLAQLSAARPPIPVLVFTAKESFADRIRVARLGGRSFLQKPISTAEVMEAIAHVLQQSELPVAKLLIVDDDPQILDYLHALLEPWGFNLTLLDDPQQFWDTLEQSAPDFLILDIEMPEFSGIELTQVVRNDPRWHELPVLCLSEHTDANILHQVFAAGADDYVQKPIVGPELIARLLHRLEREQMRRFLTEIDGLTGISNRRKSIQELTRLMHLAERHGKPLSLMLLDLDRFKNVNDQYGHEVGDRVLAKLGELLKQNFRIEDVVGRWGGEEFAIGLYGMTKNQGIARLTAFLEIFRNTLFTDASDRAFHVSFSAGVAEYPEDGTDLQALYRAADRALYRAKAAGRTRVFSCSNI